MDQKQDVFFIITERGKGVPLYVDPGKICYINEQRYLSLLSQESESQILPVKFLGDSLEYKVDVGCLHQLTAVYAGFLQAIDVDAERLDALLKKDALEAAAALKVDSPVLVERYGVWNPGTVRYIGSRNKGAYYDCISGTFFRIDLGEGDEVWVPFTQVKPDVQSAMEPAPLSVPEQAPKPPPEDPVQEGDRVVFFTDHEKRARRGMVMEVKQTNGEMMAYISTDRDEQGGKGGDITLPIGCVLKEKYHPSDMESMAPYQQLQDTGMVNGSSITLYSRVRVKLAKGFEYGVVRWIGELPKLEGTRLGLQLDSKSGVSDGTFMDKRYFMCPPKQGLFVKLSSCSLDIPHASAGEKVPTSSTSTKQTTQHYETDGESDNVPPVNSEDVERLLIGRMKGIQGHCNSCYMDSALFSLFSCSSVLDSLLFKPAEPKDQPIQRTLLRDIVNPLRRHGFVEASSVMRLRKQLQERGYCATFTTDEKDPEEFLSLIMNKILSLEPPIKLCSGGRIQSSFCYQIFLDDTHNLILPTVQQLMEQSFYSGQLKLSEVPSCLILQMPRFGKNFKMFQKIIPSLELDITALISEGPQQCLLCGGLAGLECAECFRDPAFNTNGFKYFCHTCSSQVHSHPSRRSHKPCPCFMPDGCLHSVAPPRDKMELFAVLCIDTSHYVSFLKYGPNTTDWAFFDSMSDREGESDGYNIPEVRACPEVARYLDMPLTQLAHLQPRDMGDLAKRLFCDAYMYLYQSPNVSLYH
ncbi:ubiquitin carboxyl-terminal hydrolase CYLD isoform X2 [Engraulis encrasicolus]|uniref:ubiquitin carboxyl-terminal hydrolase CYLD isoform X2 n=1 Tax=Engraulis encrasicolus TaxID=184585 RepID=UPI002FD330D9